MGVHNYSTQSRELLGGLPKLSSIKGRGVSDSYHSQSFKYKIDNLIEFLLECYEGSKDAPDPFERDPTNDVILKLNKISLFI